MEIKTTYSENLPGADFKTHRWGVEITRQVPDNSDAVSITQNLFTVAKASVRAEVERAIGDKAFSQMSGNTHLPPQNQTPKSNKPEPSQAGGNGNGSNSINITRTATPKQIKYLFQLGKKSGLSNEQIRALSIQYYNKPTLDDLTASEASNLIDTLSDKRNAA